ncbi:MAG: BamA/TamA family outer membrane protein [Candidatus Muiribacteriota bacterium]
MAKGILKKLNFILLFFLLTGLFIYGKEPPKIEKIQSIRLITNFDIESAEILKRLLTKENNPLNIEDFTKDINFLKKYFLKQGYTMNIIEEINVLEEVESIEFLILKPKIKLVSVSGAKKTRNSFLKSNIEPREGDILNMEIVNNTLNRLRKYDIFESVYLHKNYDESNHTIELEFEVIEKLTGEYSIALVYDNFYGIGGEVSIHDSNFRGSGQKLGIIHHFGQVEFYELFYMKPFIARSDYDLDLSIKQSRETRKKYDSDGILQFEYNQKETNFDVGVVRENHNSKERYNFRKERYNLSSPISETSKVDWLEYSSYREIFRGSLNLSIAKTGGFLRGGKNYFKTGISRIYRYTVDRNNSLHIRAKYEFIDYPLHKLEEFEKLLIGGDGTLRGYKQDIFSSNRYFLLNIEQRTKLRSNIELLLHADLADINNEVKVTGGGGVVYDLPIGNLRLNWSVPIEDDLFSKGITYFSFGHMF